MSNKCPTKNTLFYIIKGNFCGSGTVFSGKSKKNALVLNPLRGKNEGVKSLWNYSLNQKSGTGMVSLIPFW
ncbi:MAG: hypothetical protein II974_11310, partial [Firmicutes bacterium]|nr:hypothetical protein [Bacillota bacterium]